MTLETLTALRRLSADPTPFIDRRADRVVFWVCIALAVVAAVFA
jgi:hypothetical protein